MRKVFDSSFQLDRPIVVNFNSHYMHTGQINMFAK
jgi:hypothetical protein